MGGFTTGALIFSSKEPLKNQDLRFIFKGAAEKLGPQIFFKGWEGG